MSADRPDAAMDEAEYAAIEAALSGSERGRLFLVEHRQRARSGELAALLKTVEGIRDRESEADVAFRVEQAKLSAALRVLDEVDRKVLDHIEGAPADETIGLRHLTEAAERLQDLTWALREQGTDVATCDLIEAQSREIMAACARGEAAASVASVRSTALKALAAILRGRGGGEQSQETQLSIDGRGAKEKSPGAVPLPAGKVSIVEAFADVDALSTREKLALIS